MSQSHAILLHVAREAKMDGTTPVLRAKALELLELSRDVREPYVSLSYSDKEAFEANKPGFVEGTLKPVLSSLEAAVVGPFLLSEFTFVDLIWFDLLEQFVALAPDCLDGKPRLTAFVEAVGALPKMAAFKSKDTYIDHPYNNPMAAFK